MIITPAANKRYRSRYVPNLKTHEILETTTDVVVARDNDQKLIIKYLNFLRSGGAFAGFTPTFITTPPIVLKDFYERLKNRILFKIEDSY